MKHTEIKTKVGNNRGAARIWLEGKRLLDAGWKRGDRYDAIFGSNGLMYIKAEDGKRAVAGTESRPIIDTNSKKITEFIAIGETANVIIQANKIAITK